MDAASEDKSIGELLTELSRETSLLVRKEVELATMEVTAKAKKAAREAALASAGGVVAHAGLLVLLAALVLGLNRLGLDAWLAALIVGAAAAGGGYAVISSARTKLRHTQLAPTQTLESLKENLRWTTRQTA